MCKSNNTVGQPPKIKNKLSFGAVWTRIHDPEIKRQSPKPVGPGAFHGDKIEFINLKLHNSMRYDHNVFFSKQNGY